MATHYEPANNVDEVLITPELSSRRPTSRDFQTETHAYSEIAETFGGTTESTLQTLVAAGVRMCRAGSCGLSVLQALHGGGTQFCWTHMAGVYANYVGGTTRRDFSPCGVTLDRCSPQLFYYPGRLFTYFQAVEPPIVEGLVLPVTYDRESLGTLWIVSHDEERHFDSEDVRIMTALAYFTVAALRLQKPDWVREFAAA
jgi:hypothetical protein